MAARARSVPRRVLPVLGGTLFMGFIALGASGCGGPEPGAAFRRHELAGPLEPQVVAPLPEAFCEIDVEGVVVDTETEYLPNVVNCENGGANLEALKAQAIAARSVAYYAMAKDGTICDSQGCQVYDCGKEPTALAIQAVEETRGQYLMYDGTLTYGFYVAGDPGVVPTACIGDIDAASTEKWVTYNEGKTGADVTQTDLGFVFPPFSNGWGQNRGCMSQWGARCLENGAGYDAAAILRFFYGDDIVVTKAQGPCVPDDGGTTDDGGDTGDTGDPDAGGTDGTDDSGTNDGGDNDAGAADTGAVDDGDAGDSADAGAGDEGTGGDASGSDGVAGDGGLGQGAGRGEDGGCSVSRGGAEARRGGHRDGAPLYWTVLTFGLLWTFVRGPGSRLRRRPRGS